MLSGVISTINTKNNCFKALGMNSERYTAVHFQGWSKMTLKIKMAHFSIFGEWVPKNSLTTICGTKQASLKW